MLVRCKFKCVEATKRVGWGNHPFVFASKFSPVTSGSEENKAFYAATPGGSLEICHHREAVFEVGKEYYVDIEEA